MENPMNSELKLSYELPDEIRVTIPPWVRFWLYCKMQVYECRSGYPGTSIVQLPYKDTNTLSPQFLPRCTYTPVIYQAQ